MKTNLTFAPRNRSRDMCGVSTDEYATRAVPPYSSFAEVYDFLIGNTGLPLIRHAFRQSVLRFALEFRNLADVGCGTGAFLSTLACRPVELIGVDRSAAVLEVARRRLAGCPVTLLRQDIRRLSLPYRVDLITCQHQTLNYLTVVSELRRAFLAIARNLRRGGAFLFDFLAQTPTMNRARPVRMREVIRLPDNDVHFDATVAPSCGRSTVRIRIGTAAGRRRSAVEVHKQRWFKPRMLVRLLRATGFQLCEIRPVQGTDDGWLHVVARRV
jgi:SAM-dependent methyltransferase